MSTEVAIKKSSGSNRNKNKGNTFEWKVARELGIWMFNDREMLCRHITSGAIKTTWVGDVIPQKNIPTYWNNGVYPFLIECKNGYKNNIPNLNNQTIVRNWLIKAYYEKTKTQNILFLIASFHGYSPLLITDIVFNIIPNLQLNLQITNDLNIPFYIYDYRKLLDKNFYSLCDNNEEFTKRLAATQIIH